MKSLFLIGLTVLSLTACNKSKAPEASAPATSAAPEVGAAAEGDGDDEPGPHGGGGGGRGHRRFCDAPDAEARIAKMQKCQSEATAACNTKVYGTATPGKDVLCSGDKEKMKEVWQCMRAQYGDDREKQRADRRKMRECMSGG